MLGLLEGRVAVVTGAGRGIGRAHALAMSAEGAAVVVNDLGTDGENPAAEVVEQIRRLGGQAILHSGDVATVEGSASLIEAAVAEFGDIHILVNNAGIVRDRMLFNMSVDDWDDVIRVHMRSTFLTSRYVAELWRNRAKAGEKVVGRIVNTTSISGLFGNVGQANYGAAKAGIAAFSIIAARELQHYGVTVNVLSPDAATRMTESIFSEEEKAMLPASALGRVAAWLASDEAAGVTGRVIRVAGDGLSITEPWIEGPGTVLAPGASPREAGAALLDLLPQARASVLVDGSTPGVYA